MIGAAAKGNWQVERAQTRIEEIEQYCVLDRKELRQPRFAVITNGEPSLETIQIFFRGET
jgi:hypothetical protein